MNALSQNSLKPVFCLRDEFVDYQHRLQNLMSARSMMSMSGEQQPIERPSLEVLDNGIAVLPISGIIGKHLDDCSILCGGCDLDDVDAMLNAAAENNAIHTIVLLISSPGGVGVGVPETAARIAALAQVKNVFAFTDDYMASAGYWLGCQARGGVFCTGSAIVGSIGTLISTVDASSAYEKMGLRRLIFASGDLKAIGAEGKPWTNEELAFMQARVDFHFAKFKNAVLSARGTIADENLQGQALEGDLALAANFADGIVSSADELLARIGAALNLP